MITSSDNSQVKRVIRLNSKASFRNSEGCFVTEGVKLFTEVPGPLLKDVYVSEEFIAGEKSRKILADSGVHYEIVRDEVFRKMSDTKTPQGIICVVKKPDFGLTDVLGTGGTKPLIMVLEDLQDPGNVGTIIRTSEGAGVTGIIVSDRTADIFQPKTVRSTMGSIFRVPVKKSGDLCGSVLELKSHGVKVFAAHLDGSSPYMDEDYTGGTAFLIGNEGRGLSDSLTSMADSLIRIPMEGRVESLNAAVASALLMYAANWQRSVRCAN